MTLPPKLTHPIDAPSPGPTHIVPEVPCPYCGTPNNAVTDAESIGDPPAPGDVSLCVTCGEFLVLDDKLRTVKPTEDELVEFAGDLMCRLMRQAWLAAERERKEEGK